MMFHEYDTVLLERDLPEHDLRRGDRGVIVLIHGPDNFEVEFVRASGETQALLALATADIQPLPDEDLRAVPAVDPREQRNR